MLVRVGRLTGEVNQYEVPEGTTVEQLMSQLGVEELVCGGELVYGMMTVQPEFTYYETDDLDGGKKKKKKKKAWASKKKIKHRVPIIGYIIVASKDQAAHLEALFSG